MRAEYLFDLAHLCGVRPWETWDLTVLDFANLTNSIDARLRR